MLSWSRSSASPRRYCTVRLTDPKTMRLQDYPTTLRASLQTSQKLHRVAHILHCVLPTFPFDRNKAIIAVILENGVEHRPVRHACAKRNFLTRSIKAEN